MRLVKSIGTVSILLMTLNCTAQSTDHEAIKEAITAFSTAGDKNDTEKLDNCLDANYRVIMNRLFGSKDVNIMPKSVYLEKIKSKEFGGDRRTISINDLIVNGTTAMARVTFNGQKMKTISLITLVKNKEGQWKLVSDVPVII